MKNDGLNTIVQFRGITSPRIASLAGAFATKMKPRLFCERCCCSSNSSPPTPGEFLEVYSTREYLLFSWFWPEAIEMGLLAQLLQGLHVHGRVPGCQDGRTAGRQLGIILRSDSPTWHSALQYVREPVCSPASFISFKYSKSVCSELELDSLFSPLEMAWQPPWNEWGSKTGRKEKEKWWGTAASEW